MNGMEWEKDKIIDIKVWEGVGESRREWERVGRNGRE